MLIFLAMRLLYFWVKEFRSFSNAGFSFSSKYSVWHGYQAALSTINFKVELSPSWIDGLFPEPITDITAIIGANGSGKSSILELLADILSNKPSSKWGVNFVWVAIFVNEAKQEVFAASNSNIDGKSPADLFMEIDAANSGLSIGEKCNTYLEYVGDSFSFREHTVGLEDTAVIFYSPIFGVRHDTLEVRPTLANVSTSSLIVQDSENREIGSHWPIFNYRYNNLKRHLAFIKARERVFTRFDLPQHVEIRFEKGPSPDKMDLTENSWDIYDGLSMSSRGQMNSKYNDPIINARGNEEKQRAILEKVKIWFVRNLLTNFFHYLSSEKESYWKYPEYQKVGRKEISVDPQSLEYFLEWDRVEYDAGKQYDFIKNAQKYFELQNVVEKQVFDIPHFIETVVNIIDNQALTDIQNDDNESFFTVPADVGIKLYEQYDRYLRAFGVSHPHDFMNIDWVGISSGEEALLNLYSRIYLGIQMIKPIDDKTLFIVIDEGELGFHPEWQRLYLKDLLELVVDLAIPPPMSVQIILASHSPFLVSDLPSDNVIFLNRENKDSATEVRKDRKRTFSANIHSLFSDSFFTESTMGAFAKKKLNEVVKILKEFKNSNNLALILEESKLEYVRKVIDTVGEDVLRERLWDLYADCTKGSDLDVELAKARKKVQVLEEQKRRRDAEN